MSDAILPHKKCGGSRNAESLRAQSFASMLFSALSASLRFKLVLLGDFRAGFWRRSWKHMSDMIPQRKNKRGGSRNAESLRAQSFASFLFSALSASLRFKTPGQFNDCF